MGSVVELTSADGHALRAYVAGTPSQNGGLVLCHDDAGWSQACFHLADRLARMGYHVIAPALFDRADPGLKQGYGPGERAVTRALSRILPLDAVSQDVAAAGAILAQPVLGLVGLGWGATMVWRMAARSARYSAAVCFYGAGIDAVLDEVPRCPAQVHIGEFDDEILGTHIARMRRDRPEVHTKLYSMARQDFLIEETECYEPIATTTAMDHTQMFLRTSMMKADGSEEAAVPQAAPVRAFGRISPMPVSEAPVRAVEPEPAAVIRLQQPVWRAQQPAVFGRRATA
jgi:carboxymethylenebutenolidase